MANGWANCCKHPKFAPNVFESLRSIDIFLIALYTKGWHFNVVMTRWNTYYKVITALLTVFSVYLYTLKIRGEDPALNSTQSVILLLYNINFTWAQTCLLKIYVPVLTQIIPKMDWTYRVITKITIKSCNAVKMQHLPFIFKRNPPPLLRSSAPAIAVACYGDKSIYFVSFRLHARNFLKLRLKLRPVQLFGCSTS